MSHCKPYIANTDNKISQIIPQISSVIKRVENNAIQKLRIDWDVDVVFRSFEQATSIPEDDVTGYTYAKDFIIMGVNQQNATIDLIVETLSHELYHAKRFASSKDPMDTLFKGIINEGLATFFESEIIATHNKTQKFIQVVLNRTDQENEHILKILTPILDNKIYDYHAIFFEGNKELPIWSGYSVGYYLVKKYLDKTGKSIVDVCGEPYKNFKITLS